ncbi:MAG: hypothetical protein K6B75_06795 [Lachnospiraceae bacterium]|nr:hypothetical protein [Lachnospiraceae bacterium]
MKKKLLKNTFSVTLALVLALCGNFGVTNVMAATLTKDETVYAIKNASGENQKVIVSDHLNTKDTNDKVTDSSTLKDIENVTGYETFTTGKDGAIVWNAKGDDIYYKGTSDKALPVDLKISYTLDGKTISVEDLAGKTGKVTIKFDYINNTKKVTDNKSFIPFVALTAFILDNDTFTNVEVKGGEGINDGNRTIITGFGLPGVKDYLGKAAENITIPEGFEVSADVTDFKLGMTLTLVSNEFLNEKNEDTENAAFTDSFKELMEGLNTLKESSSALVEGAEGIKDGAAQVNAGAAQLKTGLDTLSSQNAALVGGGEQIFASLLLSATNELKNAGMNVTLTAENYNTVLTGAITNLTKAGMSAQAEKLKGLLTSLVGYNTFLDGLKNYTAGVSAAAAGAENLSAGTAALSAGSEQLLEGTKTYTDGVNLLCNTVDEKLTSLITKIKELKEAAGSYTNYSGIDDSMTGKVRFVYKTSEIK